MSSPVAKVSRPTIVSSDDEEEPMSLREWRDRNGALQSIEAAPVPAAPVLLPAPALPAAAVVAAVDDRVRDAAGGLQARDWYGEKRNVRIWPLHPTVGPNGDAWLPYIEKTYSGTTYRFFLPEDMDLTLAAFTTSASHPMAQTQLTGTPRRRSRAGMADTPQSATFPPQR
jgi:hypothetical protein